MFIKRAVAKILQVATGKKECPKCQAQLLVTDLVCLACGAMFGEITKELEAENGTERPKGPQPEKSN